MTKKKETVNAKVTKEMSVQKYIEAHLDQGLTTKQVYKLIKDGKIDAYKKGGKWVIIEKTLVNIPITKEAIDKKEKESKKKYTTKEFLEIYNEKHPKSTLTLVELRLMLVNEKVKGEKIGGKWVIYQSPSRRVK